MKIRVLWPGKTHDENLRILQEHYLKRINQMDKCEVVETKEAKGLSEKYADKIMKIEAESLEKHLKDGYIVCLYDKGKTMSSQEFAKFLQDVASSSKHVLSFVVGGFLGLEEKILKRADLVLSLSKMTYSHELARVMLLEQIYRSLCLNKGRKYAK
jgi:23S rRNA (pseudouridine1915-N3)-methyltransferase